MEAHFRKYLIHWSYIWSGVLQAYHCKIQCVRMHTALHNCNVQMALFLTVTSWWSPCLYFVYSTGVSELRIRSSAPINLVVLVITFRYFITGQTDCRVVITASRCCLFLPGNKHMSECDKHVLQSHSVSRIRQQCRDCGPDSLCICRS